MTRYLRQPATLILIAANLVPLVGVIFWHWDAFILLMLYWLETAVIAFWTIVRIATLPRDALGNIRFSGSTSTASPLGFAAFVMLHVGIFMGVHFMFLWELFGGDWARRIHGPRDFVDQVIVATGLWVPLLALFVGRGLLMMFASVEPSLRRRFRLAPRPPDQHAATLGPAEMALFGLYLRIIIMQVTIILGAFVALLVGTVGAYSSWWRSRPRSTSRCRPARTPFATLWSRPGRSPSRPPSRRPEAALVSSAIERRSRANGPRVEIRSAVQTGWCGRGVRP
jgi:hypothetical protein